MCILYAPHVAQAEDLVEMRTGVFLRSDGSVKIVLDPAEVVACREFARQSASTSRRAYEQRNQTDMKRIARQIFHGKLGEMGVSKYLNRIGCSCSDPDFQVYAVREKSFATDLMSGNHRVHVKSQHLEQALEHGLSWVFQWGASVGSGRGHFDGEVFNPRAGDLVAFVSLPSEKEAVLHGLVSSIFLTKNELFDEPKVERMRGIKKVVYYEDLLIKCPSRWFYGAPPLLTTLAS